MNTSYSIVIETYFIWSWARNASFCGLKNLNLTAVSGTAILKTYKMICLINFVFGLSKTSSVGIKINSWLHFLRNVSNNKNALFHFWKRWVHCESCFQIIILIAAAFTLQNFVKCICSTEILYPHIGILQNCSRKFYRWGSSLATQELKVHDDIIQGQTPKPSLKANSTTDKGTDWWWQTYSSRGWSPGRSRLGSTEESIMNYLLISLAFDLNVLVNTVVFFPFLEIIWNNTLQWATSEFQNLSLSKRG